MGLDNFKTSGPRKTSQSESSDNINTNAIHVIENINPTSVDIPDMVRHHTAEYIEEPSSDDENESFTCICRDCNKVATSYEGMVKADLLKHKDSDWYTDFLDIALDEAPNPYSEEQSSSGTDSQTDTDENTEGGLSAFMT
jgi:hypothetical protein